MSHRGGAAASLRRLARSTASALWCVWLVGCCLCGEALLSAPLKQAGSVVAEVTYGQLAAPEAAPQHLVIMTWNLCFLPHKLPLYFGGVRPAAQRVDAVAEFILREKPDLVCLQEMHDNKSSKRLIELLKGDYHLFIHDVGPAFITLNSGLFVASRYPLERVRFKAFDYKGRQWGINKGFLEFFVAAQGKPLAYVFNTHLQPYDGTGDRQVRLWELGEIVTRLIRQGDSISALPVVVCGDMNIARPGEEWAASPLASDFFDGYGSPLDPVDEGNSTASDFFEDLHDDPSLRYEEVAGNPRYRQIIDYLLLWRGAARPAAPFLVERVTAYDMLKPQEALSDHHALRASLPLAQ